MGMFGEIARENMGWSLLRYLERRKTETHLTPKEHKLLGEMAKAVLDHVDFPPQEMINKVEELQRRSK